MSRLADIVRSWVESGVAVFDRLGPFLGLTLLSCATGVLVAWVMARTTPRARAARARARMAAAVYEMRLYIDSPGHVLRAQARLIAWSARYLALLLPAFALLSLPLGLVFLHLDTRHGLAPLPVGEPIVMRVDLAPGVDGYQVSAGPAQDSESAIRVTAPPLYLEDRARVYLRLEVDHAAEHTLVIHAGDARVEKRISADPRAPSVHPERRQGPAAWYQLGTEPPLPDTSPITAILLQHPSRPATWLIAGAPWWLYWLAVSTASALALRRPLRLVI